MNDELGSIELKVRSSLCMPCGKVAAQAAHALGMAFMSHCEVVDEDDYAITLMVHDGWSVLNMTLEQLVQKVKLEFVDDERFDEIRRGSESGVNKIVVVDNGLTCFNGDKTETVIMRGYSTVAVADGKRMQFDVDAAANYKQGIFVDRSVGKTDNEIIVESAILSLITIMRLVHLETMTITMDKTCGMYCWLSSAFGKTVVGTKRHVKFISILDQLVVGGIGLSCNDDSSIVVTEPVRSMALEALTHSKTFRLI